MEQSEDLTAFYQAYLEWVEDGAPERNGLGFCRMFGLCHNASKYAMNRLRDDQSIWFEMQAQFKGVGLEEYYPFGGREAYISEDDCTKNYQRMKWVRDHVVS